MPREPTFATDALTPDQVAAYLTRIELPESLGAEAPSLALLSKVYLHHHLHVPKDTTVMHVPRDAWSGPSQPIVLRGALYSMPLRLALVLEIKKPMKLKGLNQVIHLFDTGDF